MRNRFFTYLIGLGIGCSAVAAQGQANHLVISEVLINSNLESGATATAPANSSEFLEIFNPTPNPILLDNYLVSDSNLYSEAGLMQNGSIDVGASDNVLRFPVGTTLQSGQVAVIAYTGSAMLADYFSSSLANFNNIPTDPLLFEVTDSDPNIENMDVRNSYSDPAIPGNTFNFSRTNGEEFILLFYWDGTSNLVKDVDIVAWGNPSAGSTNRFQPKSPSRFGNNSTPYLTDAGNHDNLAVGATAPFVAERISLIETGETTTGGNGITGHDESLEDSDSSWVGHGAFTAATPGVTTLTVPGANITPTVSAASRNIQHPTSSDTVVITAQATDSDGTIASVKVFVNTGTGFTEVVATNTTGNTYTANIGPFPDNTLVKYYVQATDDDGGNGYFPELAPGEFHVFRVDNDPVVSGDLIINEVIFDNPGGDAYEFVELHNTTNAPMDLAYYKFADGNFTYFTLPEDAEIAAGGYLLLTLDVTALQNAFPVQPGVQYYDWGTFGLNNGGDTLVLVHPNDYQFNGMITYLDEVVYTLEAPWPEGIAGTNRSLELRNPQLDNSMGQNWGGASPQATPGLQNSIFSGILLTEFSRSIEFPTINQPVVISVKAEGLSGSSITGVQLFVDSGSGFAPVNMTLSSTPNVYTAQIGGYPNGTVVKYYIQATNNQSDVITLPTNAPADFNVFIVGTTPIANGDVVVNEILYDNFGPDAYEFIELYNNTNAPIDLGYFRIVDNQNSPFTFEPGSIIAPNSYVVLTYNSTAFRATYGDLTVPVYDWTGRFGLANGGDTVMLIHPNQYNFEGASTPLEEVVYTASAPWPTWSNDADSPNSTGRSIELINPNYSDRETNGARWAWTTNIITNLPPDSVVQGTPGAQNSVFMETSVSDWAIY